MQLIIERSALLRTLGHIHSVVERRNTIPILSNVLIEARDGRVFLTATDLDIAVVESVPATVMRAGSTTAAAHTLFDIVRKLPDGTDVELSYKAEDGGRMTLAAGRSRFQLQCLPRDDFPVITEAGLPHQFKLHVDALKKLIDKTRFAISTEETRYYLNGIYVHAADSSGTMVLRGVATDGHRLARFEVPLPDGAAGMPGAIVPRKTVNELRKLLDEVEGEVEVALSDTKIRFAFDDLVLTSKLIDGSFPDYSRVIPVGNDKVLEVDPKLFASGVDRVSTISTDKTRAVKLILDKDRITLSVTSPDSGSAVEELAAGYQSSPMEIGFNAKYLLDITQQIGSDMVQFILADALAPTLVKDQDDPATLYVLMPMRV